MKWKKYTIETTTAAEDLVCDALAEIGIDGAQIEDHIPLTDDELHGMFVDIMPVLPPDDGTAQVTFYLDEDLSDEETEARLEEVRNSLAELSEFMDAGPLSITAGETDDKDWLNNWKQYFHTFMVDDIVIKPTWDEIPEDFNGSMVISMDPGAAFGTGSHETTKLCMRQLRKFVKPGDRVLDVGTGSGILSIAAVKFGAEHAFGTDLDPVAIVAARENADRNEVPADKFDIVLGNIIDDEQVQAEAGDGYDIVVANILAPVIIMLQKEVTAHIKPGGIFITSGIIDEKETAVAEALEANPEWEIIERTYENDWVSITAKRVIID